ncbi:EpsG family protein [Flavobacterium sp.]
MFFGYTMYFPENADSNRYISKLQLLYDEPRTWENFAASFYSVDERGSGNVDVYESLVVNFVSLFTPNGKILFAFYGLVFGYFYSRNIWFLIDEIKDNVQYKTVWLLIISFAFVVGFWNLNGVRMWTAAHVFFFGCYIFLIQNKKYGFLFILGSALIHFSFALPIALFIFYFFTKIKWRILYFIFIISFFVSSFKITTISAFLQNILPDILLPRIESYTGEEYVRNYTESYQSYNWYILFATEAVNIIIAVLVSTMYFSRDREDKKFNLFFGFSLVLLIAGNILAPLPSGNRYLMVAQLFGMAVVTYYFCHYLNKRYLKMVGLLSPFLLLFIIVSLRKSFDTISIMTIFTNPILATILDTPISLIDLIK